KTSVTLTRSKTTLFLSLAMTSQQSSNGAGLRILTETITSPTLGAQLQAVLTKFPRARWHQWDPLTRDSMRTTPEAVYNFADAAVIVALDSDFLFLHPFALRHARDFATSRRVTENAELTRSPHLNPLPRGEEDAERQVRKTMARLYVVEPTPSITGAKADHRLPIAARDIQAIAEAIAARVGLAEFEQELPPHLSQHAKWVEAAVHDLEENSGAGIVLAGETQPAAVHALAEKINTSLGNIGVTISPRPSVEAQAVNQIESLRRLADEMKSGVV